MRKLEYNEFKLCQTIGRIFEKSIDLSHFSSTMFIRRFMTNDLTRCYFDKSYLTSSNNDEDIIFLLNDIYQESNKVEVYSKNKMYWIGNIYGALSYLYDLSPKTIYKMFPAKEIRKYYFIYHTFDIEEASERMMENIDYKPRDFIKEGVLIFKRISLFDKLNSLLNNEVNVHIDYSFNSIQSKINTDYEVYSGYIKELIAFDCKYQEVNVLGVNEPSKKIKGVANAIVKRIDDIKIF